MFGIKKKNAGFAGKRLYTIEEYLKIDSQVPEKYEFWNGQVGKLDDPDWFVESVLKFTKRIEKNLENSSNKVVSNFFSKKSRLWLESENCLFYPDLFIVDGEKVRYYKEYEAVSNPSMIIEISTIDSMAIGKDQTFLIDRKDKFWKYQKISSLKEYVLIADNGVEVAIETYNRLEENSWKYQSFSKLTNQSVKLESIDFDLPITEFYI